MLRFKRERGLRLQSRLMGALVALVAAVITLVILVVDFRQRDVMLTLHEERGFAVAHSLSAAASNALLSYNYVALQQLTERAVNKDGVGYVIILDKEGKVAGSSRHPERQGVQLVDPAQLAASGATVLRAKSVEMGSRPGLEISVPVYVEGSPQAWGLVRVGIGLESMYTELTRTRLWVLGMGVVVLLLAALAARLLARRITGPLNRLVEATTELARGNFDHRVNLRTGDEIEDLSRKFDGMGREIRVRQLQVERTNEQLASLNSSLEDKVNERTRALQEAEQKYRILFEQSPNPICIVQDDRLVFFNRAFHETFGYEPAELEAEGFQLVHLMDPEHRDRVSRFRPGSNGTASAGGFELLARHKAGNQIILDVRSSVVAYEGRPALEAILVDVTERRRLHETVVATERLRALGEMASGVAHDFNNVLGAILARAQFLQPQASDPEVVRGLRIIEKAAQDGGEAVKRIQEFSRVRTDRDFERVALNSVLEDVIEMTRPQWGDDATRLGKQIQVIREFKEVPPVAGNVSELREVFMNLLLNAIHAIGTSGTIRVETDLDDDRVVVRVSDSGIGMSQDVQRQLFDPFFTTKGEGGNGLGMSIVYGIVQRHDGEITVRSQENEGTEFRIHLPAVVANADSNPSESITQVVELAPRASGSILVVDDEEDIRSLVADILADTGYVVSQAPDGEVALEMLANGSFDLIVTDLGMPGITGWEVAARAREIMPTVPVLLLTGWGATLTEEELEERQIDRALKKPFDMRELQLAVQSLLSGRLKRSA